MGAHRQPSWSHEILKQNSAFRPCKTTWSLSVSHGHPQTTKISKEASNAQTPGPFVILLPSCDWSVNSRRPFTLLAVQVPFGGRSRPPQWSLDCCRHQSSHSKRRHNTHDLWGQRDTPWIRGKSRATVELHYSLWSFSAAVSTQTWLHRVFNFTCFWKSEKKRKTALKG